MTEPHAVVLRCVAFEHALSLICTPHRTADGALSWSSPSDEQMAHVSAWAKFVVDKAHEFRPSRNQVTDLAQEATEVDRG